MVGQRNLSDEAAPVRCTEGQALRRAVELLKTGSGIAQPDALLRLHCPDQLLDAFTPFPTNVFLIKLNYKFLR